MYRNAYIRSLIFLRTFSTSPKQLASPFDDYNYQQFVQHIRAYAEQLYSWRLFQKRAEIMKLLHRAIGPAWGLTVSTFERDDIGIIYFNATTAAT